MRAPCSVEQQGAPLPRAHREDLGLDVHDGRVGAAREVGRLHIGVGLHA